MDGKSNIIDITALRKAQISHEQGGAKQPNRSREVQEATPVVDMTEAREAILNQERRIAKRTILTEFIAVFVVIPQHGLQKVGLHDISESGISIDVSDKLGQFKIGEEIAIRVYLSQHSYFPFVVKISNIRGVVEEGVVRHGAIIEEAENEEALYHFMKFVESVSYTLHHDSGDLMAPTARR